MESTKEFLDQWGKPRESVLKRRKRNRLIGIIAICVAVVLLAVWGIYSFTDLIYKPATDLSSAPVAAGDWSMFGRDPLHSGGLNPDNIAIQGNVKTVLTTGGIIHSSPAISNGVA